MKTVFLADTHNQVPNVPAGDLVVHCGDATGRGTLPEFTRFAEWFGRLPHKYKVFVAGNHDFLCENNRVLARLILREHGIIYLEDEFTTIAGFKLYGTPWQPRFFDWAFNGDEEKLAYEFGKIPEGLDILITHAPPFGILDEAAHDFKLRHIGSGALLNNVKRAKPRYHAFGHCHAGYGVREEDGTMFINGAICFNNQLNKPWIVEIEP